MEPICPNCNKKESITKKIDSNFNVYFCSNCENGFTFPAPSNLKKYYLQNYWVSPSLVGKIKAIIFSVFQKRRIVWLTQKMTHGSVLDVGSGEANFEKSLYKNYKVTNIEPPDSEVKNKSIIKNDFLKWTSKEKFNAITFWESLEHTPFPQKYLEKSYRLLEKKGKIFIEFPKYNCFESKLFGNNWFHLDLPRHLTHLTDKGITILLKRSGFTNIKFKNVLSLEYAPWGFTASLLNVFNINITNNMKRIGNIFLFILLIPFVFLSAIIEIILWIMGESPIGLATAQKK